MDKFRKTHRHHRKEPLAISKTAKLEGDLLKTSEYTAPQSREILQMFVCWVAQTCPPTPTPPPSPIQTSVTFRNFAELFLRSLKTQHFQIWQCYSFWGALFSGVEGVSLTGPYRKLKKPWKGLLKLGLDRFITAWISLSPRSINRDLKIRGRRRQRKSCGKSEFVFFQSSSRLLHLLH